MDRQVLRDRAAKIGNLLIGFAVIIAVVYHGSALNTPDKIDNELEELLKNSNPDVEIPVIIIFNEQPANEISSKVKKEFSGQFGEITRPANDIYGRIKPEIKRNENKNISEMLNLESLLLTDRDKAILYETGKKLDAKTRDMRREILNRTAPVADNIQAPVIEKITARGGRVKYSSKILNAVAADIPVDYVIEISQEKSVYRIYHDHLMKAELDVSGLAMGANTWWSNGYNGSFMDAAVIDTGIDATHPALSVDYANVFHAEGKRDTLYADNPANPDDFQGHGTHVAGIIASTDPVYKGAGYGIDKLINAKAGWKATDGGGYMYLSDAMQAFDWAIYGNPDDSDVISLSFGGGTSDGNSSFEQFIDAVAHNLDIPVVIAAGNAGPAAGSVGEPAGAFNVIAVGNVYDGNTPSRADDYLLSSSSRGPTLDGRIKPDISAPGTFIMSANNNWESGGYFVSKSGTSMATPQITGSILLILDYKKMRWQPEAIKALLLNTAEDKGTPGPDNDYGFGYVDLSSAYVHRDDVITDSIADLPDGSTEKFYKGTASNNDRATLVWNRHVVYNGANPPTSFLNLSNLDLYMYNGSSGETIYFSASDKNNVEQVKSSGNHASAILKIEANGTFPAGITIEDYALAADETFVSVKPPEIKINVSNPESVYGGVNFTVNVTVNNSGGLSAHNVNASIVLPQGFTVVSGNSPQALGSIEPGSPKNATWILKANAVKPSEQFNIEAVSYSNSYGELYSQRVNNTINVTIDPSSPGYINGTVLSRGKAVGGSVITANASVSAIADASGNYSLFVSPGTYFLTSTSEPVYYWNNSVTVNVTAGSKTVMNIELAMKPAGNITGHVTNF